MFDYLTSEQRDALRDMVASWIYEGFTVPPYTDAQYDIFEALGLAKDLPHSYDTVRPAKNSRGWGTSTAGVGYIRYSSNTESRVRTIR